MILTFFTDCDLEEIAVISVGKPPCSGISLHTLTLLVNQTFILILSVSKSQPPEAKACFALNFPTAVVPLLVPSSLLVQVKRCHNLVFSLFSSGTACILNEINKTGARQYTRAVLSIYMREKNSKYSKNLNVSWGSKPISIKDWKSKKKIKNKKTNEKQTAHFKTRRFPARVIIKFFSHAQLEKLKNSDRPLGRQTERNTTPVYEN